MHIGYLYDQAVALTPKAARVAAAMLANDEHTPADLRRSLCIALSACGKSERGAPALWTLKPAEAAAVQRFVAACREVTQRTHASHQR